MKGARISAHPCFMLASALCISLFIELVFSSGCVGMGIVDFIVGIQPE